MAMTLRLTDEEAAALRRLAEIEERSMQDVARQAVRDYIDRAGRRRLVDRVLDSELPRFADALGRLGAKDSADRPYGLTRTQFAIVALLPRGLSDRLIAAELGISENTVKTHLRHALRKLNVTTRAEAAAIARSTGLSGQA